MPARRDQGPVDWRTARVGDMQPCVVCGRPAHLRHPVTGRPHHKVCSEAQTVADADRAARDYAGEA